MKKIVELRKENNKLGETLNKENDLIFTDIVCYLRASEVSEYDQEEIINDMLNMFLDWQQQGKSIKSMIGYDYKDFTDNVISAVNPKKSYLNKIKEYTQIFLEGFCIMLTIDFAFLYLPKLLKGNLNLTYDLTVDMLMRSIIIVTTASAIVHYICKNSFELSNQKKFSKTHNFIFVLSVVSIIIILILTCILLNKKVIISINIFYAIGLITIYLGYKAIKKIGIL
ncbi:hypothetical protein [Clostridium niameyense]|uniref:hypothetical protein n=1 Tax=Clostridium niameyense TaxID=1622073 RepID=UPI00067E6ECC|nr:hypothetical protein [Clostridium niameyense]